MDCHDFLKFIPIKYNLALYTWMYYSTIVIVHWPFGLLLAFLFVALLLGAGYAYERIGEARDLRRQPPPGRMVQVGGHRLHLLSKGAPEGEVGPTVVIEQGAGSLSRFWWKLQDQTAAFARVCTYDRAGYGWSEAVGGSRSVEERAEELCALLNNAGVPAPYLFVAHSYGGFIVRRYAQAHPGEVAGLVLVDTPEEVSFFQPAVLGFYGKVYWMNRVLVVFARLGLLRFFRLWIPLDRYGVWLTRTSEFRAACDDVRSLLHFPSEQRSSPGAGSLGALPIIAISHGQPFPGPFAVLEANWPAGQRRLAALSSNGKLVVSQKSNHMIHDDAPELIVASIREMLQTIQAGTALAGTTRS
jgi:pimeloyl-ACP methyl ester carboxylesterase